MCIDTWIALVSAVGEWLIAFVIYYEWEGTRLDQFLQDADSEKNIERQEIYKVYCGLPSSGDKPQNELFKELLDNPEHAKLRMICDNNVRLFSRIGARLPFLPPLRKRALDWHVVVLLWEILGPYVNQRREEAGPSYAKPFLQYALASGENLLEQQRDTWTILDPDLSRKKNAILTRKRLIQMQDELRKSLSSEK